MSTPSNPLPNSAWSNPIAIQDPDRDGAAFPDPQQSANADGQDAIREGKQRAKEAMQAQSIPSHESPRQPNMSNGTPYPNGTPQLSRKRSRDGTQLPMTHAGAGHGVADTSQPSHHDILLDRYIQRDLLHGVAMNDQADRSRQLILYKAQERDWYERDVTLRRKADPGAIFGYGYAGYGNGTTQGSPNIIWPATRGAPKGRRNKQLHINRKDNQTQAEQHEELVPIRLDIELEKMRLRDTFTWNLHEKCVPPDLFADYLLEDLRIPPEHIPEVSRLVKAEMQEQLQNYYPHIIVEDGPLEPGRPYFEHKDDEMRIQIKLNITIGRITLVDQFEWDINNPLNCPEEFARHMAWENALSGEFTTAIAHSIREQSQQYTKALFLTNHAFDGRPIEDPELRDGFLPAPINSAFRTPQAQKDFTPYMYEMSEAELERTETSMMREHRAQKRQLNRRGGPALPDLREKPRTVRSLLVHSVIPGAVESFETTGILKTRRAGRGQRRAGRTTDGDVDSEELDSEESGADSPAPSALATGGTARTRGMRGAAAAAQVNMRAGYGRSATPDAQVTSVPPTEVKASARPSKLREESIALEEDEKLIVKLKINKTRLKTLLDELLAKKRAKEFPLSGYASGPPTMSLQPGTPGRGATSTPSMTPKTLPARSTPQPNGSHSRATSTARQAQQPAVIYDARGAVDTDRWPAPEDSPVSIAHRPPSAPMVYQKLTYLPF
jgi:SWI/SNF-related matrix-associated actin-dependent regulator of chromatin subfamily B protein 1